MTRLLHVAVLAAGGVPIPVQPAPAPEYPAAEPGESASAPVCVLEEDGAFLAAWESLGEGERDIRFGRREPGAGGEWSRPARLDTDVPGASRSLEPRIAVGAPGRVYVAWQDSRHGKDDLFLNRSTDGGRSWRAEDLRVGSDEPGAAVSSMASLAADGTGRVYLAWEDLRSGERDIWFARSTDHGVTWQPDVRLDTDLPGPGTSYHPQLACWDDGTVLACWWDQRDGLADLYVRRSTDGGADWGKPEGRIDPGGPGRASSRDARLAVSGDRVAVAWEEGLWSGDDVAYRVSDDRGATWGAVGSYPASNFHSRVNDREGRVALSEPVPLFEAEDGPAGVAVALVHETYAVDGPFDEERNLRSVSTFFVPIRFGGKITFHRGEYRGSWAAAAETGVWLVGLGSRTASASFRSGREYAFVNLPHPDGAHLHTVTGAVTRDGVAHVVWVRTTEGGSALEFVRLEPPARLGPAEDEADEPTDQQERQ